MTSSKDPYLYLGSGTHWRRHLKIHGANIETIKVWEFDDDDAREKFALEFSYKNNIVESKEWANLRQENGRDGKPVGSPGMKGTSNPMYGMTKEKNSFYGKKHSSETLQYLKEIKTGSSNPRAKKVTTPIGNFDCQRDAARALNISDETLRQRIKKNISGYGYL
jgi:hypothetical protein